MLTRLGFHYSLFSILFLLSRPIVAMTYLVPSFVIPTSDPVNLQPWVNNSPNAIAEKKEPGALLDSYYLEVTAESNMNTQGAWAFDFDPDTPPISLPLSPSRLGSFLSACP